MENVYSAFLKLTMEFGKMVSSLLFILMTFYVNRW